MFKKIALAAALAATASFATWDKFPVLEAGKGQAKVGLDYKMQGDWSGLDLNVGARYTIVQNFELGVALPYTIFTDYDGQDGADGLGNLPIMVRYQFMPILNAFLDVELPIGEEELIGNKDGLGLHFGVQFSQNFGMVNFGSELGLALQATEGDNEQTPPWDLNLGVEGDFAVNEMITPYVGLDLNMLLGKFSHDGDNYGESHTGDMGVAPYLGVGIAFNPMFTLDLCAWFGIGDEYYGEDTAMSFAGTLFINF